MCPSLHDTLADVAVPLVIKLTVPPDKLVSVPHLAEKKIFLLRFTLFWNDSFLRLYGSFYFGMIPFQIISLHCELTIYHMVLHLEVT